MSIALLLTALLTANPGYRQPLSADALAAGFAQPPQRFAPFIFWFWDAPLEPAKMAEMSRTLASVGFNPGYAHARHAMVNAPSLPGPDWLSDKWFESFGAALGEAEKAGAFLGYCDEYWWPSLQANGRVLAAHPELRAQSLSWTTTDLKAGAAVELPAGWCTVAARLAEPLPAEPVAAATPAALGKWIWHPRGDETRHRCWLRRAFTLDAGAQRAELRLTADNEYTVWLDGTKLGEAADWTVIGRYDVTRLLTPGPHVLAVETLNWDGPCGLTAGLRAELPGGVFTLASDRTWRTSLTPADGWLKPDFDDRAWTPARELHDVGGGPWHLDPATAGKQLHRPRTIVSASLQLLAPGTHWTAPAEGDWRVYTFSPYYHAGVDGGQVNCLDTRLAPAFIELALEPYARRTGDQLGRSIPGDFTDHEGAWGWKLAWSDDLAKRWQERCGDDLRRWLPCLLDEDREGASARVRWQWFDLVSDLYSGQFGAVRAWHERRGMSTTAHVWEESLTAQLFAVGDHLKLLRNVTMPGQDCLGPKALQVHDFKEPASVAEFEGRRAMTELMGAGAFGSTPWGTFNPTFLKQALNAVTAWGVSHVIPHGVFTQRKLTGNPWPPDWYADSPMFPQLRCWNDFARRASYVVSHGDAVPDVLLYNPLESLWVRADWRFFAPGGDWPLWNAPSDQANGQRMNRVNAVYSDAIGALTAARVEFLVGDRHYLGEMTVEGSTLARGPHRFQTVVLPPLDAISRAGLAKLVEFAQAGGRVYALGELPTASVESGWRDPQLAALVAQLTAAPTFARGDLPDLLAKSAPGLTSPVRLVDGAFPLLQHRRRLDGRDFLWLANNTGQPQHTTILLPALHGAASKWDCETGARLPLSSTDTPEGSRLTLDFGPLEAFWLVLDPHGTAVQVPPAPQPAVLATLAGPWTVRYDPAAQPTLEYPSAPPAEFAAGVVKPLEDWRSWGLRRFSGRLDYRTSFTLPAGGGRVLLDLGRVCHAASVSVNGQDCGQRLWGPHVFDVSAAAKAGTNEVVVRVANLLNNSYGDAQEGGLLGPVRVWR